MLNLESPSNAELKNVLLSKLNRLSLYRRFTVPENAFNDFKCKLNCKCYGSTVVVKVFTQIDCISMFLA